MRTIDLSGEWMCMGRAVALPGTLDEAGVGPADALAGPWHPDAGAESSAARADGRIATRLTRRHAFVGEAVFSRKIAVKIGEGERVFLECERARRLRVRVNGREAPSASPPSLSAPQVFELTGLLTGEDALELVSDNRYPGWPRREIVCSSAATDETQTNWNGVLGFLRLRVEARAFVSSLRVYPQGDAVSAVVEIDADGPWRGEIALSGEALCAPCAREASGGAGVTRVRFDALPLRADAPRWDLGEGALCEIACAFAGSVTRARFGVRDLGARDGCFTLNGRRVFLRGETNCAVFPRAGHPPMDKAGWLAILQTYRGYGVNFVRFHSHCPPEAAFEAADEMGMLLAPELSHWEPKRAFATEESRAYYRAELLGILRALANHPSFAMLALGNELQADEAGCAAMEELLALARSEDATRLYAEGSNNDYGERGVGGHSDFYAACGHRGLPLRATDSGMRGWLNRAHSGEDATYEAAVRGALAEGARAVMGFEAGQYQSLPDFAQIDDYTGVTDADNLRLVREAVAAAGLLPLWPKAVEASGELALRCYRAEVEAALRTDGMGGIALLGLQDFPGQGTALVGMLDGLLRAKPYAFARPERFRAFFCDTLPLAALPRRAYRAGETLRTKAILAHFGKEPIEAEPSFALTGAGERLAGTLPRVCARPGERTPLGEMVIPLPEFSRPARMTLRLTFGAHENAYDVFVYPDARVTCPTRVTECRALDDRARAALAGGGAVYLSPDATEEALPGSVRMQFSTDFWSSRTFPEQSGCMGLLIDEAHPIFRDFPTSFHTDWQWRPMACRRAAVLSAPCEAIVTALLGIADPKPMAALLECRCGGGRLLFSTLGLHDLARESVEARALQNAIYRYLASDAFAPRQELPLSFFDGLVAGE